MGGRESCLVRLVQWTMCYMAYAKTPFSGLFDLHSIQTYFEYNKLLINIYWYYISSKHLYGVKRKVFYTYFNIFWSKNHGENKTKQKLPYSKFPINLVFCMTGKSVEVENIFLNLEKWWRFSIEVSECKSNWWQFSILVSLWWYLKVLTAATDFCGYCCSRSHMIFQ